MTEPQPTTPGHTHRPEPAATLTRDFTADDVTTLRHAVAQFAADNGMTDVTRYWFVLAVHEVAVNAVRHGGGKGHLELWYADGHLQCRITDHGPGVPTNPHPGLSWTRPATNATSGRGLWLAQRVCQITTFSDGTGTTVGLTCPITPSDEDLTTGLSQ
jgi:anti-sigma regulatory factor (Ser/Thr protein kinase)